MTPCSKVTSTLPLLLYKPAHPPQYHQDGTKLLRFEIVPKDLSTFGVLIIDDSPRVTLKGGAGDGLTVLSSPSSTSPSTTQVAVLDADLCHKRSLGDTTASTAITTSLSSSSGPLLERTVATHPEGSPSSASSPYSLQPQPVPTTASGSTSKSTVNYAACFREGDRILSVNGKNMVCSTREEILNTLAASETPYVTLQLLAPSLPPPVIGILSTPLSQLSHLEGLKRWEEPGSGEMHVRDADEWGFMASQGNVACPLCVMEHTLSSSLRRSSGCDHPTDGRMIDLKKENDNEEKPLQAGPVEVKDEQTKHLGGTDHITYADNSKIFETGKGKNDENSRNVGSADQQPSKDDGSGNLDANVHGTNIIIPYETLDRLTSQCCGEFEKMDEQDQKEQEETIFKDNDQTFDEGTGPPQLCEKHRAIPDTAAGEDKRMRDWTEFMVGCNTLLQGRLFVQGDGLTDFFQDADLSVEPTDELLVEMQKDPIDCHLKYHSLCT